MNTNFGTLKIQNPKTPVFIVVVNGTFTIFNFFCSFIFLIPVKAFFCVGRTLGESVVETLLRKPGPIPGGCLEFVCVA